jgi:two-component system, NarL family, sensor kinase
MAGNSQHAADEKQAPRSAWDPQWHLFLGTALQCVLRTVLAAFAVATLLCEPPRRNLGICVAVLVVYLVILGCWSVWSLRPAARAEVPTKKSITLLMLTADVSAISVLSVLSGLTSPNEWTSDVMRNGFFLIPLIAAAQLDPIISGVVAMPTLSAFLATCWITQAVDEEPSAAILLSTTVLAGLAGGSVALSFIQRSKVDMITDLAGQRRQLLEELLDVEKHERQTISERLHDGALQYVLLARQDMEDVRDGSTAAAERIEFALIECSQLLRDVVRELHPDILARLGLKAAIAALTERVTSRTELAVEFDADAWPDSERTEADYVLYSGARETVTNVIKHAHAHRLEIELSLHDGLAKLRVADDGVGASADAIARKADEGHIGLSSIRTKALASGGLFQVRSASPGTEITVSIPLPAPAATIDTSRSATVSAGQGPSSV